MTGNNNYVYWSNHVTAILWYCKINKILTGKWPKPDVTNSDATSELNTEEWKLLNTWITLHLHLSEQVQSQFGHLETSHQIWLKLKKMFKPQSNTSITLHLTSIIKLSYNKLVKFEDFIASKHEHNHLLKELGGTSLPDSYITILICSGLPEHLKQTVTHISDDLILTDQLVNIICSHQQESLINTMQTSPSDTALFGCQNNTKLKKWDFQLCRTPGCPKPDMHPMKNCWAPGGPKHGPNHQWKLNQRNREQAHKADNDEDNNDDDDTTSMKIHINRSFVAKQSKSDLLYSTLSKSSTSSVLTQHWGQRGSHSGGKLRVF